MTREDHALFAGAAVAGLLLAAFQIWYVALPFDVAAHIDALRWTGHLDAFDSLHRDGAALLPVLVTIAGVLLFEAALAVLASGAEPPRSDAWAGLARLASFPASGLAIYVLLDQSLDRGKASPTSVAIALLSVGQNVLVVLRAKLSVRVRDGGAAPWALAAAAALFALFLGGAAGAARVSDKNEKERALQPPAVVLPDFEQEIPREGAAALGDAHAPVEVLLFLDPEQEESRNVLKDALAETSKDVILHVYLKGRALPKDARALLEAAARGDALPTAEPSILPGRALEAARITEYPTAIWRGGRQAGAITLAHVLHAAASRKP
ncbi:MAG TPA: hypothetical protein VFY93_06945 [Planctomycetota bacterium]|nr:hypothetical protein [Planctomycetota bacterium]